MKPEGLLPFSQQPVISHYPESNKFTPRHDIPLQADIFQYHPSNKPHFSHAVPSLQLCELSLFQPPLFIQNIAPSFTSST
jgi:hypothetical protein